MRHHTSRNAPHPMRQSARIHIGISILWAAIEYTLQFDNLGLSTKKSAINIMKRNAQPAMKLPMNKSALPGIQVYINLFH